MGAATLVEGTERHSKIIGLDAHIFRTTTAANAEDGVDVETGFNTIIAVLVLGAAAGKYGPFFATWSGGTVTIKGAAVTAADSAEVSVLVLGHR